MPALLIRSFQSKSFSYLNSFECTIMIHFKILINSKFLKIRVFIRFEKSLSLKTNEDLFNKFN